MTTPPQSAVDRYATTNNHFLNPAFDCEIAPNIHATEVPRVARHIGNWSYAVLEREVRANLVYRNFARVGGGKMPDAKTMGRWGVAVGPQVLKQIHERVVKIALEQGVVTVDACASTRQWWKPTSIIQLTQAC